MGRSREPVLITKASGERLPFSEQKLRDSLIRSGADRDIAEYITGKISEQIYEGMPTKKIYRLAFQLLRKQSRSLASRYHLKRGIMELGPTGFPFEQFIGEILKAEGYSVRLGEIVKGQCVDHEIDVIAEREHHHFMIECKYHNLPGTVCDVKIPLYIQARFKDVEAAWKKLPGHGTKFHQGWVVTNTRFTSDAITYGNCAGLKLIGWDYPNGRSLRSRIDQFGLYPLTCLTSLTRSEKRALLRNKVVLCHDICDDAKLLAKAGVNPSKIKSVQEEGRRLCEQLKTRRRK